MDKLTPELWMNHLVQCAGEPFEKWDDAPQNKFKFKQSIKFKQLKLLLGRKNNLEKTQKKYTESKKHHMNCFCMCTKTISMFKEKKKSIKKETKKSFSTMHLEALKPPPGFPADGHRIVWHGAVVLKVTAALLLPRPAIFLIVLIFSSDLPAACTLPAPPIPAPRNTAPWSWPSFCI